ncbi:MAG: hypothetical protein Q9165_001826 [Trypethelium subeluteriae]
MSLFGGNSTASRDATTTFSQSSSDDEDAIPTSAQQSATRTPSNNLGPNEVLPSPGLFLDSTASSDAEAADGASSPSSTSSSFSPPPRPNRYTGPYTNWITFTQRDRAVVASLDQQRANDLSIHLYNAHRLKTRLHSQDRVARSKSWTSKFQWMELGRGRHDVKWHLKVRWTAWPLVPERVPRPDEVWGMPADDGNEAFTLKREEEKASEVIEDVLIGVMMGQAREQWDAREWEDEGEDEEEIEAKKAMLGKRRRFLARRRKRMKLDHDKISGGPKLESDHSNSPSRSRSRGPKGQNQKPAINAVDSDAEMSSEEDSAPVRPSRPVFMANEEQERLILKPIVRSQLSDLDALLGALHYTAYGNYAHNIYAKEKFPRFDPTIHGHLADTDTRGPSIKGQFSKRPEVEKDRTSVRGPQELSDQDTVSASEMISNGDDTSDSDLSEDPIEPAPSATDYRPWLTLERHGMRDWSEILNAASTIGWDRHVIHRAAQRCSALFGETMSFRILKEEDVQIPISAPIKYTPEKIPPLPKCDDGFVPELWDGEDFLCPFPECPEGNDEPYTGTKILHEHMRHVHNYDHFQERRVGAVQNDGFLQPITRARSNPRRLYVPPQASEILVFGDSKRRKFSSSSSSSKKPSRRIKKTAVASRGNAAEVGGAEVKSGKESGFDNGLND